MCYHSTGTLRLPTSSMNNDKLKSLAEHFCRHEFDILGSGWKNVFYGMDADGFENKNFTKPWSFMQAEAELPQFYHEKHGILIDRISMYVKDYIPIDWQIDFKSGARFCSGVHHSQLKYGVIEGCDAKVSADLGRLYQLVPLAKAYHAFKDDKYKNELLAQLLDFMAFNPPEYGAAWRANMNVAIRAANIIAAVDILGWHELDNDCAVEIMENLVAHGNYIFANLEFPENHYHPNHFIANLAGLLMVSCITAGIAGQAEEWHNYAVNALREQIIMQSYPEGTNFEGATSYHCLVLEMLTGALIYAARNAGMKTMEQIHGYLADTLGAESMARYRKMFEAYRSIVQPDGLIPLIGDNDSGRFLYLEKPELDKRDYRFLAVCGATLFNDPSLLVEHDQRHAEYAEILFGYKLVAHAQPQTSCSLPEVGYYIMRDNEQGYAFINCGPVGTGGKGGHAHNDKLALTLQLGGKDIFVDPGIYAYTASEYFRNFYRSVKSHNTLCLAGEEQNRWGINPWWGVLEETKCECLKWQSSSSSDIFTGQHHAYERLEPAVTHKRTIFWDKTAKQIVISDELSGCCNIPESECGFVLAPECKITFYSENCIVMERDDIKVKLTAETGVWKTAPAFYSPEYGVKKDTQRLILKLHKHCACSKISISY